MVEPKDPADVRRTALLRLYAAYGADARRWPVAAAHRSTEDGEGDDAEIAQGRKAAGHLDELLDAAGRPEIPAGAAARAVVAALAAEDHQTPAVGGVLVDLAARTEARHSTPSFARFSGIAAMAASLLLGVYMGANGLTDGFISSTPASASATSTDYDIVQQVLADLQEDMG